MKKYNVWMLFNTGVSATVILGEDVVTAMWDNHSSSDDGGIDFPEGPEYGFSFDMSDVVIFDVRSLVED